MTTIFVNEQKGADAYMNQVSTVAWDEIRNQRAGTHAQTSACTDECMHRRVHAQTSAGTHAQTSACIFVDDA